MSAWLMLENFPGTINNHTRRRNILFYFSKRGHLLPVPIPYSPLVISTSSPGHSSLALEVAPLCQRKAPWGRGCCYLWTASSRPNNEFYIPRTILFLRASRAMHRRSKDNKPKFGSHIKLALSYANKVNRPWATDRQQKHDPANQLRLAFPAAQWRINLRIQLSLLLSSPLARWG